MRIHANRGRFFEEYLQHLHARYREQGRARIDFIPTPTRPRNGRSGVGWAPVHKGIVDFVGVLAGGRFVAFGGLKAVRAKSTSKTGSWRIKTSRRSPCNDTSHQWEYLSEVHALGGLAFYLIYAEELDRVFVARMPFEVGEAQSFAEMIEVVKGENGWWDWLKALEQAVALGI